MGRAAAFCVRGSPGPRGLLGYRGPGRVGVCAVRARQAGRGRARCAERRQVEGSSSMIQRSLQPKNHSPLPTVSVDVVKGCAATGNAGKNRKK